MFGASKPLASLSSGLLARKGQARPAMRPQGFANLAALSSAGDQLGWNDMGDTPEAPPPAPPVPPVLVQREVLAEELAAAPPAPAPTPEPVPAAISAPSEDAPAPVSLATAQRIRRESRASTATRKAAFTLRLDAERHLRLRLASATRHRSSQQLVTEALDAFLATLTDVDALVARLDTTDR